VQSNGESPRNLEPGRPRAIVVVGVGRSGTSAITRGLQALGVELGDELRRGRGKNPTGFFEDEALRHLTRRLKRALGVIGASVRPIATEEYSVPAIAVLQAEAAEALRQRLGSHRLWGFKHGRTLRFLPFWQEVFRALDLDVSYVVATRNPLSVARSRGKLDERRGVQEKSDLEWLANVVPNLRMLRGHRFVVVDYDRLMADPGAELRRIATVLELPLTAETGAAVRAYADEFLRGGMRHSHFTDEDLARDPRMNPLTRDAYRCLYRLATLDTDPDSPELWREWRGFEDQVALMAPALRYVDKVEADVRRAKSNPAGPLQALPNLWRKLRGR
jgi:hypothetical protein